MAEFTFPSKTLDASRRFMESLSERDEDRLVAAFVRLALATARKKVPLKREDIIKKALGLHNAKAFAVIYNKSQQVLRALFGVELMRLPDKNQKETNVRMEFALRSVLDEKTAKPLLEKICCASSKTSQKTLLCIVLSIILAEKRRISENLLYKFLEQLDIYKSQTHPVFGNVEECVELFVKEEYLERVKFDLDEQLPQQMRSENRDAHAFAWGPRSKVEFPESSIISFIAEIFPQSEGASIKSILSSEV